MIDSEEDQEVGPLSAKSRKRRTILDLQTMKAQGEKIAVLTAYDYPFARLMDQAGIDIILVGDSVGAVVAGYENTLPVTMEEMIYHTRAVARGASKALLVADMPFMSYSSVERALGNAGRLMRAGASSRRRRRFSAKFRRAAGNHRAPGMRSRSRTTSWAGTCCTGGGPIRWSRSTTTATGRCSGRSNGVPERRWPTVAGTYSRRR